MLTGYGTIEAAVAARLYDPGLTDPDLLIRTGGEMRVSNYLLWQIAYAEFWVTGTFWQVILFSHCSAPGPLILVLANRVRSSRPT